MKRYFEANVEDAIRIAIVEAETTDDIREVPEAGNEEIPEDALPVDFSYWKQYTAHAYNDSFVYVMSRDGE